MRKCDKSNRDSSDYLTYSILDDKGRIIIPSVIRRTLGIDYGVVLNLTMGKDGASATAKVDEKGRICFPSSMLDCLGVSKGDKIFINLSLSKNIFTISMDDGGGNDE